jgi:hypothetical protein
MQTDSLTSEEFLALYCLCISRAELLSKGATPEQIYSEEMSATMESTLTNFYDLINKEPENLDKNTKETIKKIVARAKSLIRSGE